MSISEDRLMAYLDGELEPGECAALETAIAADAELSRRVANQRALREKMRREFDRTLEEDVPHRLVQAAQGSNVVEFGVAASRARPLSLTRATWFAAAASFALGAVVAPWLLRSVTGDPDLVVSGAGLVAGGELERVLSRQLATERNTRDQLQTGISFVAKSGEYCRTFVDQREGEPIAALACRKRDRWQIEALEAVSPLLGESGEYRQAASALPPLVLAAAQARMAGEPLDTEGEAAARASGWKRSNAAD